MTPLDLLVALPTAVVWPLAFALALPVLVYIGVTASSTFLSGRLALRIAQGAATLLGIGFAIIVIVATIEVLRTGLADRAGRHEPSAIALARAMRAIPDVVRDSARARPQLELVVATEARAVWAVLVPTAEAHSAIAHTGALDDRDLAAVVSAVRRAPASESATLLRRRGQLELLSMAAVRSAAGTPVATAVIGVDTRSLTESASRTAWLLLALTSMLLVTSVVLMRRLVVMAVSVRVAGLIARLRGASPPAGVALAPDTGDELHQLRTEVDRIADSNVRLQRENDTQYQVIVERMPDAVMICAGAKIQFANAAAVRLLGSPSAESLVGTDLWSRLHHEPEALDAGPAPRWVLRRDDGALRHVEISEASLGDGAGARREIVVRDVTAAVRAELALARSEAVYRTLFDAAPIGIAVVDDRMQVLAVNPALLRLFALTRRDEMIGCLLTDTVALPASAQDALRRGLTKGGGERFTVEFTPRDAMPRSAIVTMQPLTAHDGSAQHELLWLDITAQRALESQVQHTQKLDAVGQLSSGIAHDFNNLLTIIRANASLLGMQRGRALELDAIEEASVRGSALIRKLLIFSRKEGVTPKPWRVADLFDELVTVLRRLLPASIALRTPRETPELSVLVDRVAFEQVLINLVTNACDAMPDGGTLAITVDIVAPESGPGATVVSADARERVRFSVIDSGTGMTAAVKSRAFEPFFTTKPAEKGTGLGLAIVYGLVAQMEGTVEISDAPGGGTCVTVALPACEPCWPELRAEADPVMDGAGTLLLVEDDEAVRKSTMLLLARLGYSVTSAEDGVEALALLDAGALPDLIVSDVMMPRMGGVELVQRIRSRGWTVPMLLVSGYATESLAAVAERDPLVGILGKPWAIADLSREIQQRITRRVERPEKRGPGSPHGH